MTQAAARLPWFRPLLYAVPVGLAAGAASALFLRLLEGATVLFDREPQLLFGLPVFAALTAWLYLKYGGAAGRGTELILDRAEAAGPPIPLRVAPLVLFGTLATHLGGGSAGREGTAVQMSGTLADRITRGLPPEERRRLIAAGIAGGFGAVFGTPLAGAVFSMEAPHGWALGFGPWALGQRREKDSLSAPKPKAQGVTPILPALLAAWIGHWACLRLGTVHTDYRTLLGGRLPFSLASFGLAGIVGLAAGGAARLFIGLTRLAKRTYRDFASPVWRAVTGAFLVVAATFLLGTRAYNGLSIPLLVASFNGPAPIWAFAAKAALTAFTLGAGMKGGEVTPLFVIGSTLGSALAGLLSLNPATGAALGFCAVFSGATRTPLTCLVMGMELFGPETAGPLAVSCGLAFLTAGREGIYGR